MHGVREGARTAGAALTRLLLLAIALCAAAAVVAVPPSTWLAAAPPPRPYPATAEGDRPEAAVPSPDEPLAEVRIEGNTTIPTTAIAKYVKTRPGRPATERQVREDVKALYGTRWFFSVEPRYRRTDDGLVLIYRVLERPVVQKVEYRGNEKVKEKHLAARTGLKPGSPFDISANREAARRLENWYHEEGYSFARVTLAKGDHKNDREVIFDIYEGPKVRVGSVKFEGNEFFSSPVLKTKLRTKSAILWYFGGLYDPATIRDDIASLKQYYHSLGFFDVQIEHEIAFNRDRSRVYIKYLIDEGPRYQVRDVVIHGNRVIETSEIRSRIKLVEGEPFNARTLLKDVEAIKEKYGEQGRIFARVDAAPRFLEQPGVADLVYEIDEDRIYYIRRIDPIIRGEHPITKRTVILNNMRIAPGEPANQKLIEASRKRLEGIGIFERGPQNGVEIRIERVVPDEESGRLPTFRAQSDAERPTSAAGWSPPSNSTKESERSRMNRGAEGSRHAPCAVRRGRFKFPGVADGRRSVPATLSDLRTANDPFDISNLNPDGTPRGRAVSRALADTSAGRIGNPSDQRSDPLPFVSGPLPAFHARGPLPSPERDGTVIRAQSYEDGIRQPGTPLFNPSPQGDPLRGEFRELPPGQLDIIPEVSEARTGRLMFGVGVNSDAGVVGQIILSELNFDILRWPTSVEDILNGTAWRGGGQRFRLEAIPGNIVSRYLVSWSDPFFLDTDFSVSVSGFYYNRFFDDWDERRGGGRFSIGRQITHELSIAGTIRLEEVRVTNPEFPTPPILARAVGSNFLSGAGVTLTHDTRDSPFLPGEGHLLELAFEQTFGEFEYPRASGEFRQYWTVWSRPDGQGRHIVSAGGQVGWTDAGTPIFERFYAGGFQTFRGFEFRGVTPRRGNVKIGGRWMALGTVEYLFPLMANEMLQGAVFSDFGTVEEDVDLEDFRVTAGFGFRVTVPAMGPVPLAFDFAFPIVKEDFDDERVFSFFVGFQR